MTFRPANNALEPTWPAHGCRLRDTGLGLAKRLSSQPLAGESWQPGSSRPPTRKVLARSSSRALVSTSDSSTNRSVPTMEASQADLKERRKRLERRLAALEQEEARQGAKLGNSEFLRRAPAEVVEKARTRHAETQEERTGVEAQLADLAKSLAD